MKLMLSGSQADIKETQGHAWKGQNSIWISVAVQTKGSVVLQHQKINKPFGSSTFRSQLRSDLPESWIQFSKIKSKWVTLHLENAFSLKELTVYQSQEQNLLFKETFTQIYVLLIHRVISNLTFFFHKKGKFWRWCFSMHLLWIRQRLSSFKIDEEKKNMAENVRNKPKCSSVSH